MSSFETYLKNQKEYSRVESIMEFLYRSFGVDVLIGDSDHAKYYSSLENISTKLLEENNRLYYQLTHK